MEPAPDYAQSRRASHVIVSQTMKAVGLSFEDAAGIRIVSPRPERRNT
jgi:hypothetical protein